MEEVGQGHSGEGREDFRAVQGVVHPLGAPPLGCDCGAERKVRTAWPTQGSDPRDSVGGCYTDPEVHVPPGYSLGPEHPAQNVLWEMCCSPPTFCNPPAPLPVPTPLRQALHVGPQGRGTHRDVHSITPGLLVSRGYQWEN